jgi:hypothetical protein
MAVLPLEQRNCAPASGKSQHIGIGAHHAGALYLFASAQRVQHMLKHVEHQLFSLTIGKIWGEATFCLRQ